MSIFTLNRYTSDVLSLGEIKCPEIKTPQEDV
jgi:hypothetical protein